MIVDGRGYNLDHVQLKKGTQEGMTLFKYPRISIGL
jgi:hypothetical protein